MPDELDPVKVLESAEKALRPFANRIFNDNGDMTLSGTHALTLDDYAASYYAHRKVEAALLGARAMQAAMARREVVQSLVESLVYGADMISEYLEKYHDYEGDTPAKSALRGIMHHLQGASLEPAGAQEGAEVPGPLYKRVEAILDEHSAWIARPNDEVTKRVALAAMFAAHAVLIEEEAPEDRYLRDGATHAPVISDETINTVRAHAIHHAAQGGMPQAEAEDHFGTPTPAGAGDLVERAKATATSAAEAGDFEQVTRTIVLLRDLASRIEALEAEVDGWRKATWEAREGIVQRDERLPLLMNGWTARATTAEAERVALKAEVERLRVIVGRFCQANDEGKLCDDIDNDGSHYPSQFLDDTLNMAAAALAPAKAGG
ncbi:hypothetical protein [Ancylobacter sp. IITR112]|uniref:hypothetical protein n=1 Tax=Ancylobacter sp. IITR112 TaxID=3138073 RepID=UPI00352BC6E0